MTRQGELKLPSLLIHRRVPCECDGTYLLNYREIQAYDEACELAIDSRHDDGMRMGVAGPAPVPIECDDHPTCECGGDAHLELQVPSLHKVTVFWYCSGTCMDADGWHLPDMGEVNLIV